MSKHKISAETYCFNEHLFDVVEFSDGQKQISLSEYSRTILPESIDKEAKIYFYPDNFGDFELLIQATHILREKGLSKISLEMPYFFGARSDRKFTPYSTHYIKNVIAPVINSLGFYKVYSFTPHSDVIEACINNFQEIVNIDLLEKLMYAAEIDVNQSLFVSPDGGALKRVYKLAEQINVTNSNNIVCANKHRDIETGKILSIQITIPLDVDLTKIQHIVILDDICDGGRTFTELVKAIKSKYSSFTHIKFVLYVAHSIFSQGLEALFNELDVILTTDSRLSFPKNGEEKESNTYGVTKIEFQHQKHLYIYSL